MLGTTTFSRWGRGLAACFLAGALVHAAITDEQSGPRPARVRSAAKKAAERLAARQQTRRERLEHFREFQLAIRNHKRKLRAEREQARLELLHKQAPRCGSGGARSRPLPSLKGVSMLLMALAAVVSDPSLLGEMQASPLLSADLYAEQSTAALGQLDTGCAAAGAAAPWPCSAAYLADLGQQAADIQAEMAELFVDPQSLGAGACLPGETPDERKERVALDQGDILALYARLVADAQALGNGLNGVAYVLESVGDGLIAGDDAAEAAGAATNAFGAAAVFVLEEVGEALVAASYGVQVLADLNGKVSSDAGAYRARYQLWANSVNDAILANCNGTAGPAAGAGASGSPRLASPFPAIAEAEAGLRTGCALAERFGVLAPVCSSTALDELTERNATLGNLYQGTPCLTAGLLGGSSLQGPCRRAPEGSTSRVRSDTIALYGELQSEINAVANAVQAFGNGLIAGSRGLAIAANAAARAGNSTGADALSAAAEGLNAIADGIYADGFFLLQIGAWSQRVLADVILAYNAETREALDAREANRAKAAAARASSSSSSTGAAAVELPGDDAVVLPSQSSSGADAAPLHAGSSSAGSVVPAAGKASGPPSANAAGRPRPLTLGGLVQLLLPGPAGAGPAAQEF